SSGKDAAVRLIRDEASGGAAIAADRLERFHHSKDSQQRCRAFAEPWLGIAVPGRPGREFVVEPWYERGCGGIAVRAAVSLLADAQGGGWRREAHGRGAACLRRGRLARLFHRASRFHAD